MKVISKFLTADMRITAVAFEGKKVVLKGLLKNFMPMTVEVDLHDVVQLLRVVSEPLRTRILALLPAPLRALVESFEWLAERPAPPQHPVHRSAANSAHATAAAPRARQQPATKASPVEQPVQRKAKSSATWWQTAVKQDKPK